jgi:hypothetical protein
MVEFLSLGQCRLIDQVRVRALLIQLALPDHQDVLGLVQAPEPSVELLGKRPGNRRYQT